MPVTLRMLLAQPRFHLTLRTPAVAEEALDRPIAWVHNSELPDPTPWLQDGQVLLTDGLAFLGPDQEGFAEAYVHRLTERGIVALGFATQIAHDEVPGALIEACGAAGLPLVEVADRVPFMAIIRHVADVTAREQRERLEWSSKAQRAIARAALRPDGLGAILQELERQLDCWVALYDAIGNRMDVATVVPIPPEVEQQVADAVRDALGKGTPRGGRLQAGTSGATLQTIGHNRQLRGMLAVGIGTPLDAAENDLISSVIGLASIALEQSRALETARMRVRAGVLELLLAGVVDVAGQTAKRLWGRLPRTPIRVAVLSGQRQRHALLAELELDAERHGGRVFFADRDDEVVVVTHHDHVAEVTEVLERHGFGAGISAPASWTELPAALREARKAAQHTAPSRRFVPFESLAEHGFISLLEASGASLLARRILAPVLESANPDHRSLLPTLSTWLEHNGAWEPSARALNIHRHTLRNRLHTLEGLLEVDLSRFSDRAELWSALQLVDQPSPPT